MTNERAIDRLVKDILKDEYLNYLLVKLENFYATKFLKGEIIEKITEKEFIDLLRFADILSNSDEAKARNKSYDIISFLFDDYSNNPVYKTVSTAILSKLGNFPALDYLKEHNNYTVELPLERELERQLKVITQAVPGKPDTTFTDIQFDLFTRLQESEYYSFSGPTSIGKSFIIRAVIRDIISSNTPVNIVVLVPTRALINQFSIDLKNDIKESNRRLKKYRLLTNSNVLESENDTHYILVLTPERFSSYLTSETNPEISCLFVDEAQKLAALKDPRSITYFQVIERAIRKYPNMKMYFSSPNVSNPEIFLKLFSKEKQNTFTTIETPVSQHLFFVDLTNHSFYLYPKFSKERKLIEAPQMAHVIKAQELIDILGEGYQNLIYCNTPPDTINWAVRFAENRSTNRLGLEQEKQLNKSIKSIEKLIHKDYYLVDCLKNRVAFHFGYLPQMIRYQVEELFKNNLIDNIFCTSTLLEGVNLPAKNVFIIKNKVSVHKFEALEFKNLAGRAGRLRKEMSGNIVCIRENEKDWEEKDLKILDEDQIAVLTPSVQHEINTQLEEIEKLLKEEDTSFKTQYLREMAEYLSNILCIYSMEQFDSKLLQEIRKKKQNIDDTLKNRVKNLNVPIEILNATSSIGIKYQDDVYKYISLNKNNPSIILPSQIDTNTCHTILTRFYSLYNWEITETGKSKLREYKKTDYSKYLGYLSLVMYQWINGESLNQMISSSINYHHEKLANIYLDHKPVRFNINDKSHVNLLINEMINNIEKKLRYTLEKYFTNYYATLAYVLGEEYAGSNWAVYLEYGTRNKTVIALQNLGFSRHLATFINKNHGNCIIWENRNIVRIDFERLLREVDNESTEFDEIEILA